jgi:hypothetical protein
LASWPTRLYTPVTSLRPFSPTSFPRLRPKEPTGRLPPEKRAWLRRFDSGRDRFREVAVTESAGASPLKAVAFPDYSRSIPRQTTALANDPSESFPPSCFFVGSLSVWWRVGTLAAAAASPQAKPPAGVVAAPGCPPTPARDRGPSGDLGGRPWLLSVCWRCAASAVLAVRFPDRSGPETVPR